MFKSLVKINIIIIVLITQSANSQNIIFHKDSVLNNYIDTAVINKTKRLLILPYNQKYFILDSAEFAHNNVITTITGKREYKDFVMDLKFYVKDTLIGYKQNIIDSLLLFSDKGYFYRIQDPDNFKYYIGDTYDMRKKNEEICINNPKLVHWALSAIPEPHRLITDRRSLKKRTAEEAILSLLNKNAKVKNPEKLKKRIKKVGPWKYRGIEKVQISQIYLENWHSGGENSISLQSDLSIHANYTKNKIQWENYLRHRIGIIGSENYPTQINTDKIILNSKFGYRASKKWYYSSLFNTTSQLFRGYNNKKHDKIISTFLSPAYFTLAFGMDYKRDKNFTLLLSPFTAKATYINDTISVDAKRYKIAEGHKTAYNIGASVYNYMYLPFSTELNLKSEISAFLGYSNEEYIKQIDWEITFNMRVNRFLSTGVNLNFRYYTNESDKLQLKEYFTINFNYKW